MNKKNYFLNSLSFIFAAICLTSCASSENIAYFKDLKNVKSAQIESSATFTDPTIEKDDIIYVNVSTLNPQSGSGINQLIVSPTNTDAGLTLQPSGFIVDKNGEIELSIIGKVKIVGLTTYQARELIREKVSKNYKDPNIQLRFANFKVSVLGEVNKPSTYTINNEKVSILDALSLAGDLTIYGKRENVMVVRDNNGVKEYGRLDLNSSDMFSSPYFYLKQNDVLYIEPNKRKMASSNSNQIQTVGVLASILSVIVIAIANFK